jgi:hypothetical protein
VRLCRRRVGKTKREHGKQIRKEDNQKFLLLLPQKQDEEELVLQDALPLRMLPWLYQLHGFTVIWASAHAPSVSHRLELRAFRSPKGNHKGVTIACIVNCDVRLHVLTWEVAAPDREKEFAMNHPVLRQRCGVSISALRWIAGVNIAPLW